MPLQLWSRMGMSLEAWLGHLGSPDVPVSLVSGCVLGGGTYAFCSPRGHVAKCLCAQKGP